LHDERFNLKDLGIDYSTSHRWQREASVSDGEFEAYLATCREGRKEVTSAGLIRLARERDEKVRDDELRGRRSAIVSGLPLSAALPFTTHGGVSGRTLAGWGCEYGSGNGFGGGAFGAEELGRNAAPLTLYQGQRIEISHESASLRQDHTAR